MGLFSTKKKTVVNSTAIPLIKADSKGVIKESVINSVLANERISVGIQSDLLNGYGVQFRRAFSYAQTKYARGVPEGYAEYAEVDETRVERILEQIEGKNVWIAELYVEAAEYEMYVNQYLLNTRKVDFSTRRVGSIPTAVNTAINNRITNVQAQYDSAASSELSSKEAEYSGTSTATETKTTYQVGSDNSITRVDTTVQVDSVLSANVSPVVSISTVKDVTYEGYDADASGGELTGYDVQYDYTLDLTIDTTWAIQQTTDLTVTTTVTRTPVNTSKEAIGDGVDTVSTQTSSQMAALTDVDTATVTLTGSTSESKSQTINETDLLYYCEYVVQDKYGAPVTKAWVYNPRTGVYPTLNIGVAGTLKSPFYPVIPLRLANVDLTQEDLRDTDEFKTSKRLLNTLGLDIDDLAESVNENPDVGDIDNAYVFIGMNIATEGDEANKCLAMFFDHLAAYSNYDKSHYDLALNPEPVWVNTGERLWSGGYWVEGQKSLPPVNLMNIKDESLDITLEWHYITITDHQGVKTGKGKAVKEINIRSDGVIEAPNYRPNEKGSGFYARYNKTYSRSDVTFYYQTDTDTYRKIVVHGLKHTNLIYRGKSIVTDLSDTSDEDNHNFLIPLHYGSFQKLSLVERTDMYKDAVFMVFNSYDRIKVKWYQTAFFRFIILAVTIVIAAVTYQPQLAAAAAAGGLAVAKFLLLEFIKYLVISEAIEWVIEELGFDAAMILVVAYTLWSGDFSNLAKGIIPTVETMMNLMVAGLQVYSKSNALELEAIADEIGELTKEQEILAAALETANDLLDVSGIIDPGVFMDSSHVTNPNETVERFFLRTLSLGEVNEASLQVVAGYTDIQLTLPEPPNF